MDKDTLLNVAFKDKDSAKALGARWDSTRRTWFVPAGLDLAPFVAWLPQGASTASSTAETIARPVVNTAVEHAAKGITLSALLGKIKSAVEGAFVSQVWVQAEISEINTRNGGHVYLDLVERSADGILVAKSRAAIWAGRKGIVEKFCQQTGQGNPPSK